MRGIKGSWEESKGPVGAAAYRLGMEGAALR